MYSMSTVEKNIVAYDNLSYLECISALRWVQGKLTRARHELANVLDMISLTDNPSNRTLHMKYELSENIKDLTVRAKSLNRRIYIYENKNA